MVSCGLREPRLVGRTAGDGVAFGVLSRDCRVHGSARLLPVFPSLAPSSCFAAPVSLSANEFAVLSPSAVNLSACPANCLTVPSDPRTDQRRRFGVFTSCFGIRPMRPAAGTAKPMANRAGGCLKQGIN